MIKGLKQHGAAIVAYKPIAVGNMRVHLPDSQVRRHLAGAGEVASTALIVPVAKRSFPLARNLTQWLLRLPLMTAAQSPVETPLCMKASSDSSCL